MDTKHRIDWVEVAAFGAVGTVVCAAVLVLPSVLWCVTMIALIVFLLANAYVGLTQRRLTVACAFLAGAALALALRYPVTLALAYVAVFSVVMHRSVGTDAANAAPSYILFGREERRY